MKDISIQTCRNCGSAKFKSFAELTEDEKFVIERLPDGSGISDVQRNEQRFCARCLYQEFRSEPEEI
jgi:predicted nucleic-acid-binding Zn-ribbon protein